jgi:uncharacterized protein YqeY
MNNTEFIEVIDKAIHDEMLLGLNKNENKLIGLRNIKTDFNYIASREPNALAADIVRRLYKERVENVHVYLDANKPDLLLQEYTERDILRNYLPQEPSENTVRSFLNTLVDIPKQKSSFKKFQDACIEKFGMKVDSTIIIGDGVLGKNNIYFTEQLYDSDETVHLNWYNINDGQVKHIAELAETSFSYRNICDDKLPGSFTDNKNYYFAIEEKMTHKRMYYSVSLSSHTLK